MSHDIDGFTVPGERLPGGPTFREQVFRLSYLLGERGARPEPRRRLGRAVAGGVRVIKS